MHTPALFMDTTMVEMTKLAVALVLGVVIGTERAILARQAAGMRTFGLVALGASLFIVISNYVDTAYVGVVNIQPLYMAAGIITGIGFIGGGLIVMRSGSMHGITTAAGLWITAAIGVAVGFGMYAVAVFAAVLTLLTFTVMWLIEERFKAWFQGHADPFEHLKSQEDHVL